LFASPVTVGGAFLNPKKMIELRQIISDINVLEARNRQFELRSKLGVPAPKEYDENKVRLEGLYKRRSQLIAQVDVTEPQYPM